MPNIRVDGGAKTGVSPNRSCVALIGGQVWHTCKVYFSDIVMCVFLRFCKLYFSEFVNCISEILRVVGGATGVSPNRSCVSLIGGRCAS